MKRWGLVRTAICLAFGFGMATTVCAANRAEAADVRCIAVAMHLASSAAPEQRAAGMLVAMYYFGKLDGSFPHADIERLIQRDSEAMTLAELRANAAQCAKTFEKKSREFARIDADLAHQRRGRPSRK